MTKAYSFEKIGTYNKGQSLHEVSSCFMFLSIEYKNANPIQKIQNSGKNTYKYFVSFVTDLYFVLLSKIIMSNYITALGLEKLKSQLVEVKQQLKEVTFKIKEAREFGDLSENAEYHEAKNEQAFLAGKEMEIENKIKNAQIIEKDTTADVVVIGSSVDIVDDGEKMTYQIVGSEEADPLSGRISVDSPIGRALMGKKSGDMVEVETPAGVSKLKIQKIA